MRNQFSKHKARLESGQSLVEMALGMVVLVFLISGLLDLGRVYFTYVALEDGAGEAALYLSINPDCPFASSGAQCALPNNAEWRAMHAGRGSNEFGTQINLVDWNLANIVIEGPPDSITSTRPPVPWQVGEKVRVRIEYPFRLLTPFIPRITGLNPITLYVNASATIMVE
jgi:hypothetical protein